jgi:probable phosphoglycerate mutase
LTAHGENEARGLAQRLRLNGFTRVLVSPRLRARQTCELAGFALASEIEPDLAEWDYGDYEGRRSVDIRKEHPDWNIWRDGCPDGETPAEVSARADRVIAKLCTMHGNIALFSHGQFGAALAARWIGLPLIEGQHFALHPASLSILAFEPLHPDRRLIELWNETAASRGGG